MRGHVGEEDKLLKSVQRRSDVPGSDLVSNLDALFFLLAAFVYWMIYCDVAILLDRGKTVITYTPLVFFRESSFFCVNKRKT